MLAQCRNQRLATASQRTPGPPLSDISTDMARSGSSSRIATSCLRTTSVIVGLLLPPSPTEATSSSRPSLSQVSTERQWLEGEPT
eukprot:9960735-Prorocentrum_lima.AAC.1